MKKLQELHSKIDIEIVELLLSVIPEGWYSICLEANYVGLINGEERFSTTVFNKDNLTGLVDLPDEVHLKLVYHLDVFRKYGKPWKKLLYEVEFDEAVDNWKYSIDFTY